MSWRRPRALLYLAFLVAAQDRMSVALSSIHHVHGKTNGCKLSERMFADQHGLFGMGGRSRVVINGTVMPLADHQVADAITVARLREYFEFAVAVVSYTATPELSDVDEHSACARDFGDPREGNMEGKLQGTVVLLDDRQAVTIHVEFAPLQSGLQVVLIVPCWKQKSEAFGYPVSATEFSTYPMADPLLEFRVCVSFRNPHGYLPALLYGMFPFSAVLSLLYGTVDVYFICMLNRRRRQAVRFHLLLLIVLGLSTAEAVTWWITYKTLNQTGERVCCPCPLMLVISTIVRLITGLAARIVTTLFSLGIGIVRNRLARHEVVVLGALSACYSLAVGKIELHRVLDPSGANVRVPAVWETLAIASNVCFAGWIFASLALTRESLMAYGQTAQLNMYVCLTRFLYAYVVLSLFLIGLEGAVHAGNIMMDWQHMWLIWAANRLLVFLLLFAISIMWRPSGVTRDASSSQRFQNDKRFRWQVHGDQNASPL